MQTKSFFKELLLYQIEYQNIACLASFLKRGKNIYAFKVEKDNSITCKKYTFPLNSDLNLPIIEYKKFKQHLIEKLLSLKLIIEQTMKEPLKFYEEICYTIPLKERLLILNHLEINLVKLALMEVVILKHVKKQELMNMAIL